MDFDLNKTPEYAADIPTYENEIWLLALKLGLNWEMLKSVMWGDEVLYNSIHSLGFEATTKAKVYDIFSDRYTQYCSMTTQERHLHRYRKGTLKRLIKMLLMHDAPYTDP